MWTRGQSCGPKTVSLSLLLVQSHSERRNPTLALRAIHHDVGRVRRAWPTTSRPPHAGYGNPPLWVPSQQHFPYAVPPYAAYTVLITSRRQARPGSAQTGARPQQSADRRHARQSPWRRQQSAYMLRNACGQPRCSVAASCAASPRQRIHCTFSRALVALPRCRAAAGAQPAVCFLRARATSLAMASSRSSRRTRRLCLSCGEMR